MKRITKSELQTKFANLKPMLEHYCSEFPEYDLHEMLKEVLVGDSVLWMGENSFAIGCPLTYHKATVFMMECTAGDLTEILEAFPVIEADIKAWGFNEIELVGRLGWTKAAKPYGFEPNRVVLRKTIGEKDGRQE